jgi:hypothetical protein
MKNIHVLPTDKPSRLFKCRFKGRFILDPFTDLEGCFEEGFDPQNTYITNSEEIKEGDYFWKPDCNMIFKAEYTPHKGCQKVILTTDQDLIKDGVQSIDDEFLEWFVKNPSCEEVEIFKFKTRLRDEWRFEYKIIIPKEEPKQRLEKYSERFDNDDSPIGNPETWGKRMVDDTPKKETLEEVLLKKADVDNRIDLNAYANGLNDGAKWQQERSYSEEDMIAFGEFIFKHSLLAHSKGVKNLFEQFKKK